MNFPITRETLQSFDYKKYRQDLKDEEIQKKFTQMVDQICKEFEQRIEKNIKEKQFVWNQLHLIRNMNVLGFNSKTDEYLPQFIDKLKEVFIGCDIIIDPLKTYLIIGWS